MTNRTCWICGARSRYKGRCSAHMDPRLDAERVARALAGQSGRPLEMPLPSRVTRPPTDFESYFAALRRRGGWPESLPLPRDVRSELGLEHAPIRKESP